MPNEDRIRRVYDLLTEAYDIPQPFEEVQNKWQTSPESRRKAYDLLTEAYEIQQPYEEFEQLFAPGYNEQGQAAATAVPSKPAPKQGDFEGKTQPAVSEQVDSAARVVAAGGNYTPRSIVPSNRKDWDAINERASQMKQEELAKKEELERQKAEAVENARQVQADVNAQLRPIRREERRAKWKSLGEALLRSAAAAPGMTATSAAVAGGMSPSQKMAMEGAAEAFKEYGEHKLVAEALDESIDYVNAVADQRGVGKGAWDYATRIGTFDFGYSGTVKGLTLQQLAEKAESGELLSEEEERVLDMVAQATYLTQLVQDGVKMGYNVGASLPQSLGFMAGIALNPASGLGQQMMKRAAKKYGERAFKTMATRALGDVAEMGIATLTTGSGRVLADAIDRVNGDVTYDITPEGYIAYGGQQNQEALWKAAAKAFGTNFIENYTEALGEYFSPLGNMLGDLTAKNLRRMNLGGLVDFINAIPQSQWGKMVGQFMEATKFNGVVGEILEEEIGMFLEPVFVGDSTLAENFNIWSDDPEIADRARDNQLTTILSCALMSGMLYGVQGAGARGKLNRELAHADREGKRLLGEEGWNNIHTLFDSADGDAEKLERLMKDVVYGKELTNEQRTAIVDYAAKMVQANQFNASNDAAKQEMTKTASELSAAYDAGYRMATLDIPQNFRGVRDDLYWSEDAILEYDKNHLDINLLEIAHNLRDADMATREQVLQGLPSEQADLVKTYLACSERFNGLYQGTKDAMDADKMTFIDMVRPAIITNADGQEIVRTATTAYGESVYVVGGEGKVSYILDGNGQKSAYPTDQLKGLSETTVEELESQFDKALEDRYMARLEHYTQHNEQTQEPVVGMILGDGNENYVITDMGEGWATIQEAMTDKEGNMVPKPDGTSRDVTKDYLLAFQDQIYDRRDVMDGKPVPSSIPAALQQAADDKTEQVQALQQRAEQWAAATGVAADIYEKAEDIPDKQTQQFIMQQQEAEANGQQTEQIVTGWYDTKTGRIAFYLPNIKDESDLDRTYIHEVISHKGLRELLKDNSAQEGGQYWRFDNLMQRVWDELMTDTDRQQYMDYVKRFMTGDENKLQRAAADEFVASFSETLKLNPTDEVKTLWDKFVEFVRNILDTIGVGSSITNEDLSTLLQASMDRYREQVKQEHTPKDFRGNPLPMRTNKMTGEQVVNANALWQNDPEAWALWNDSQPNRLISSKERLEDSIADLDKQIKKENTALIAAAKKGVDEDKIDEMRYELDKKVKLRQTYQDILARLSQPAAAAETVAGQQRKAAAAETVASAAAGFAGIQENWNKAPKAVGLSDEIVLPNGEMIRGHYVLIEAWAPTPSHNPADGFKMSAGFPVDENGKTVNDRDYEHDKAAQQSVLEKAGNYDQRALQTPVIVTADGVVLSGNDRTMASQLAATGGTDQAYTNYLGKYAQKYGFTAEQVGSMEHPRVLFVPDVPLGYNAATFAKFNAEEKKSQNKVESAVKAGKTISPAALGKLAALVNGYEDINALYNDENGANDLIGIMLEDGYITQEQVAALKEGSKLSGTGMDFLESTLIGAALEEDAVRIVMDDRSMRHSIVSAISQIIANSTIEDYNLRTELADAIALVAKGKASKVIKFGDTVQDYIRQGNLFEKDVVAEATVQLLADALNNKKTTTLKKVLSLYNTSARDAANGQMSIFSGDVETKDEILVQILNDLGYATRTFDTFKRAEAAREGQDSAGAESGEAGDAGDGERPGEVNRNREFVRAALMESGDEYIDLTDYMSDDECDEFMRLYEEYEPFQDAVGEAYEKYDKQLKSKDKAKKAAAEKKIDKLVKAQEKAFEPIQDYVEDLLSLYGLADVDEVETEEEVPEISVERPGAEDTEVAEEQLASEEEVEKQTYTPDEWEDFVYGGFCDTFESPRSNVRYQLLFVDDRFNIYKNHSVKLCKDTKDGKYLGEAGGTTDYILKFFKANGYKRVSGGSVKNKYGYWINEHGVCMNPVKVELPSVKKGWAQMNYFTYYKADDGLWYGGGSASHGDGGGTVTFPHGYENRSDLVKAAIEDFERFREANAESQHYTMRDVENLIKELKNRTLPQALREEGVLTTPAPAPVQGELFGTPKKKVVKKVVKKKGKKTAKKTTVKKETTQENDIEKMTYADVKARGLKMGDKVKFRGQTAKVHHFTNLKGEPYSVEVIDNSNEHYLVLVNDTSAPVEATQKPTESQIQALAFVEDKPVEQVRQELANPSGNKLVTDEQYEKLRERMRQKLNGQMNMGVDPEIFSIGVQMAVYHIEKGARKFVDFAKTMIDELGDAIRPYLKSFYNGARDLPEMQELAADMDSYEVVSQVDTLNFDRQQPASIEEIAENSVKERESVKNAEKAKKKILDNRSKTGKQLVSLSLADGTEMTFDKNDYQSFMTPEAKSFFETLAEEDEEYIGRPFFNKKLAYITYASDNGAIIPADVLEQLPEFIAAEQRGKELADINGGPMTLSDVERETFAKKLLALGSMDEKGKFTNPVAQEKKAFIVIGRPAGGKSSVFADPLSKEHNARIIDSDIVKEWLSGYEQGLGSGYVQEASASVADAAFLQAALAGDNMVIPRIGGPSVIFEVAIPLRSAGYTVELLFNEVPERSSIMRAASRFARTGRYLSLQYLQSIGDKPLNVFKKFGTLNIGEAINELSEKQVQKLRGRIESLSGKTGESDGTGRQAGNGSGQETLGAGVQTSLGTEGLGSDLLNSTLFNRAEWKNNDVPYGEQPKLISSWSSQDRDKTEQSVPTTPQAGDQLTMWDLLDTTNNDNDTGTTQPTQGESEADRTVGGVSAVGDRVLGSEGPGQSDGGEAAGNTAGTAAVAGTEQGPVRTERSGGGSEGITDLGGEEQPELSDGGPSVRSGNAAAGRSAVRRNLKESGEVKKASKPSKRYTRNFSYDSQSTEIDNYTPQQRYKANVEAVEVVAKVLTEGRSATDEEKVILSRFRGWGGVDALRRIYNTYVMRSSGDSLLSRLAIAIDTVDPDGTKGILEAIRTAALTSFYTPSSIARSMNRFVTLAGFKGGSLLDPSMGSGIFEGTMEQDVAQRTMIYGVEKDWLTGQIAKLLYPDGDIKVMGFEEANVPMDAYDVVESNIPFGDFKVADTSWKGNNTPVRRAAQHRIHNYFAVKMLESTKPGGICVIMTSNAILDTPGNAIIREHIADQSEVVGVIRLPDNTFKGAGTAAVTDVIMLRKFRDEVERNETRDDADYRTKVLEPFLSTVKTTATADNEKDYEIEYNGYFGTHKDYMIGDVIAGNQYRHDAFGLTSKMSTEDIAAAMDKLTDKIVGKRKGKLLDTVKSERAVYEAVREAYVGSGDYISNGNLVEQDGKFGTVTQTKNKYGETSSTFEELKGLKGKGARLRAMFDVRTAMKKLIAKQIEGVSDDELKELRGELQKAYDKYVKLYGRLNDAENSFIDFDIDAYTLRSLEKYSDDKFVGLSDIFTKNTIKPAIDLSQAKDAQSTISVSLAEYGEIRPAFMENILGEKWFDLCKDFLFEVPFGSGDEYVTRDAYLSGDVKTKLEQARRAADADERFERNVKALEEVQPRDLAFEEISIRMGARWVPQEVYTDFMFELFGLEHSWRGADKSGVRYSPEADMYTVAVETGRLGGEASNWSTNMRSAKDIFEAALEDRTITVKVKDSEGNEHIDIAETEAANQKVQDMRQEFEDWLPRNADRAKELTDLYNDKFNRSVIRKFDGSHLQIPGLMGMELRPHQKDAVWMLINNRGGIVDHMVGAGKTLVMQSAIMEMRRMGIAKKPMIVALKSTVAQITKEFIEAYPSARVLAPTERDFEKTNRKKFLSNIALNDYDCIIVSHEQYVKLPHTEEVETAVIREQLDMLQAALAFMYGTSDTTQLSKRQIKAVEKRIENLKAKMAQLLSREVDREFTFEGLGIDYLFVDECQAFKSLPYVTSYGNVSGLGDATGSQKAVALLNGVRYLQQLHQGDMGTTFLSGTTITNSLVEIYNLLNYLRPREMRRLGLTTFDAWANTFAEQSSELEYGVTTELKYKARFRRFDNVPELSRLYAEIADVRNDMNLKLPKPQPRMHIETVPASDKLKEINQVVIDMVKRKDGNEAYAMGLIKDVTNEKSPYGLLASGISTKAAISLKLLSEDFDDEGGKVGYVCENVAKIYKQFNEQKGTQLIFCDTGVPGTTPGKYNVYDDIIDRLTKDYGIPREEVVDIHVADTDKKRKELFQKVREGKVRILIGGTKNMGTGVNVQTRVVAMHHIDVPWTPADREQREGRGVRQGNEVAKEFNDNMVDIYFYAAEESLDVYKYQLQDIKGRMFTQFKMGTIGNAERSFDEGSGGEDGTFDPAEVVALLSGNPVILEKSKQDKLVEKLRRAKRTYESEYRQRKAEVEKLTNYISEQRRFLEYNERDIERVKAGGFVADAEGKYPTNVTVELKGVYGSRKFFDKPKEAGEYIHRLLKQPGALLTLTGYGMTANVRHESLDTATKPGWEVVLDVWSGLPYRVKLSDDDTAAGSAFRNVLQRVYNCKDVYEKNIADAEHKLAGLDPGEMNFPKQAELDAAEEKKKQLDAEYKKLSQDEDKKPEPPTPDGTSGPGSDRESRAAAARALIERYETGEPEYISEQGLINEIESDDRLMSDKTLSDLVAEYHRLEQIELEEGKRGYTGSEMTDMVESEVLPRLRALSEKEPGQKMYRMVTPEQDAYNGKSSQERSDIQYQKAQNVLKALQDAGFKDFYISRSINNFGVSTYIQGMYGLKFRLSDQSVASYRRIMDEEHVGLSTPDSYFVDIAKEAQEISKERVRKLDERKEKERKLDEKWERIKSLFEGLGWKTNDRTYQNFEEFSSNKKRSNILQTPLGIGRNRESAYRYEWTEPIDAYTKSKPSYEWLENFDEELSKVNTTMFRMITPEMDKQYAEAYERGDTELAESMVRDAFKAVYPNTKVVDKNGEPLVVEHATNADFTEFDIDYLGKNSKDKGLFGAGFYFGTHAPRWLGGTKNTMKVFLGMNKPFEIDDPVKEENKTIYHYLVDKFDIPALRALALTQYKKSINLGEYIDIIKAVDAEIERGEHDEKLAADEEIQNSYRPQDKMPVYRYQLISKRAGDFGSLPNSIQYIIAEAIGSEEFSAALKEGGYDGVIADRSESYKEYVAFYPPQIKSAEPFTLDDNGKLIPLSQRFQPESSDIRYRMKLQQAEQETDTNPTDGQKEAGNYKKGHVRLFGMDLSIEQPKGSVRRGTDPDGKEWEQEMHNTYGYIRGTMGRDKDHIDVFLGDNLSSDKVFVVDQRNIQNGSFDEHKVMLGFDDIEAARDAYYSNYEEGWTGLGAITETSLDAFKAWAFKEGRRVQPFNQTEGDGSVLFRMREPSEYKRIEDALGVAAVRYERAMDEAGKRMGEVMSDSMRSVKELQDAIAEQTGRPIRDYENAYWAAIQYSSRNKAMQDAYHKKFYRPLLDEVYSLTKDAKDREEALDKLNAYLMAKHGLERNEKFAMRDAERDALEQLPEEPRKPDEFDDTEVIEEYDSKYAKWKSEFDRLRDTLYDKYRRRDYSGLTALFEKKKVVEAEIDAQLLVDSYEKEHDTAELWRLINAATKETLRTSVQGGVITQEKYIELANMFDNYVPLRGFDETTSDDVYGYYGTVNSPYNTAIKKAYGRRSLSDSPLATIGNIADSEIMRANRNRIYMAALSLAENHHTGLMSVSEVMFRRDPDTGEWSIALPDLSDADTPELVAQKMSDFRKWFAEQLLTDDVNYRLSSEMARVPYKVINKSALDEHQIIAMRGGKQYIITVNGNPRAAQALAGKTNPDSSPALNWLAPFNRFLAGVFTQYNPSFVLRNLTRDGIYTNAMVWAKEDRKYALAFNKNWSRVLANMAGLLSKYKSELLDDSQPIERYFREFIDNGGETGYTQLRSVKDYKKIMKRELKDIASASPAAAGRKVMSVLGEAVENMNRWAEGVSRYAAFLTSREQGRSVVRSVEDAKEISVNFNKKGSGTAALTDKDRDEKLLLNVARVSQLGRELFVFFNAGVQGMANFTGIVKNNPQKAVPLLTGLFLGGAALAMMNGGGGDDDDEKEYYNLPEYIRRSNICLKAGKHWLTVPMPIELRCFYGLGELAYSVMSGNEFYEGKELAYEVASQLTQILPIDFLEGNQGTVAFVPSAVKPIVEAYWLNQDWTGTPIYNDSPFNENDPAWRKAFKSTSPALVAAARKLNEWTGGNVGRSGVIDINPARVEHLFEGYLGGVGTIMNQAYKSGRALTGDLDMREVRNIPVVSGFMRDSDGKAGVRAENSRYHKINDMVDGIINEDRRLRQVLAEKEISGYDYDDKVMKEAAERLQELRGSKEWEFAQQWRSMDKARTAAREGRDEEAFNKLTKEMNDIYIQFKRADND